MPLRWFNIWFVFTVCVGLGVVLSFKLYLNRDLPPLDEMPAIVLADASHVEQTPAKPEPRPQETPVAVQEKPVVVHPTALSVAQLPARIEKLQKALDGEQADKTQVRIILRQIEDDIVNLQDRKWLKANLTDEEYAKAIDLRDYARTLAVQAGSKWKISLACISSM